MSAHGARSSGAGWATHRRGSAPATEGLGHEPVHLLDGAILDILLHLLEQPLLLLARVLHRDLGELAGVEQRVLDLLPLALQQRLTLLVLAQHRLELRAGGTTGT